MKKKSFAFILSCFIAINLWGCGENTPFFGSSDESGTTYEESNKILLPMEKVRSLNPALSLDEDTYYISKLVYDGLFVLDGNLMPQINLVESYSYDDSGLNLTLQLKQGVKWHDGEELTAADVKFSVEAYQLFSYTGSNVYGDYVNNIRSVSVKKGDAYRFVIAFREPAKTGLENLLFPILPSHQFKRASDMEKKSAEFIPVGTGPYKVEKYENLSRLILTGNPEYRDQAPQNILEFNVFPEKKNALNLIDVGSISLLFNKDMDRDTLISNMDVKTVNYVSNQMEFIGFNFRKPIMKNRKLRQAIACAVDTKEILESIYMNSGVLSDTIYYPNYFGISGEKDAYPFDLKKSRELLAASGLRDKDGDGYLDDAEGETIRIGILVNENDRSRMDAAQIIKNGLDKLPIDSYIIYGGWDEYVSAVAAGDFDIYVGGYTVNERYDLHGLLHSGYSSPTAYANPELDALLDKMQTGIGNAKKAELFSEVHAILVDDIPYYCLLYKTYGAIASPALVGEMNPIFMNPYWGSEGWFCRYEVSSAAVAE